MKFDYLHSPYLSKRVSMIARNGMVATSQPLAAQAGLDILKKGGNAIDAAIATSACLTVVEPTSNGIGGDAFALVWINDRLYGLNASGPAPKSISIEAVKEKGFESMPKFGWVPVTVPGVPSAWAALSERFGRLPLTEVLKPAINYAEKGYPVSPTLGKYWQRAFQIFKEHCKGSEFTSWFETFAPNGKAPEIGEMWRSNGHADTLRSIAESNAKSFYQGELAEKMAVFSKNYDGFLSAGDLATYKPEWVDPISMNYRGIDVWEIPPNGQGLLALMALNTVKGFEFPAKDTVDTYHHQIEAMKLAFTDGQLHITDQRHMSKKVEELLSEEFAKNSRRLIGDKALLLPLSTPAKSGTIYLATADNEGNMVSYIQSNYMGIGSGLVVPGTGIALQNRGADFSLNQDHANALQPGKKTYHTIIPGFLTKNNVAIGPFGVMGGYMQPQGHMQVVMNTVDFHLNPQAALDAPRWQWTSGKKILVEHHFPHYLAEALARKGHDIHVSLDSGDFGRGQIIWRDPLTGVLYGGTESRTDGSVAAY